MTIEIVQGNYAEAMHHCKNSKKETIPFELAYIDTDEKAFAEFNRFLEEISVNDVVGQSEKRIILLNLSTWNEKHSYNHYFESFLYMMSDMAKDLEYKLIFEKEINKELYDRLTNLGLFEFRLIPLKTMIKYNSQTRIGFFVDTEKTGVERNV